MFEQFVRSFSFYYTKCAIHDMGAHMYTPGIFDKSRKVPPDFGNWGGGLDLKRNNSTSKARKVRSR
jgi:hypothetical protein